jgi:hypothetical protein
MNSSSLAAAMVALGCVQTFQTLVTFGLLKRYKVLQRSVKNATLTATALPVGTPTKAFTLPDVRSRREIEIAQSVSRGRVLLFLSPGCSFCIDAAQSLSRTVGIIRDRYTPICVGLPQECASMARYLPAELPVLVDEDWMIARQYGASTFPTAVVLSPSLTIQGYAHPLTDEDLTELAETPTASRNGSGLDVSNSEIPLSTVAGLSNSEEERYAL